MDLEKLEYFFEMEVTHCVAKAYIYLMVFDDMGLLGFNY